MSICKICNVELKNINGLAKHITNQHQITKQEYYDTYISNISSVCVCGNKKVFRGLGEGYRKHCSVKCRSEHIKPNIYWQGKKQPQEMVDLRRNTLLKKYGVSNGFLVNHPKAERYKGFLCRSNYEKMFVDFAEEYNYTLSVPERITFTHENKTRYFYPDFYIKELDLIVEVKSNWTWLQQLDLNLSKMVCTIEQGYDIVFIDEEHGLMNPLLWNELNEYLCTRL